MVVKDENKSHVIPIKIYYIEKSEMALSYQSW